MSIRSEDVTGVSFGSGPAKALFETSLGISMCVHATRHALATSSLATTRALYKQSIHTHSHHTHIQCLTQFQTACVGGGGQTYIPVYLIDQRLDSREFFCSEHEKLYFPSCSNFSLELAVPLFCSRHLHLHHGPHSPLSSFP
jgi:hypothetical protein